MSSSVNKVILVGNLGKDPESRTLNSGDLQVTFSIATSESWRDKQTNEKREKTEWHNVVVYNQGLAKVASDYLRKGSKVYIEGQLRTRKWQDQQGQDRYTTEVVLAAFRGELVLLGDASRAQAGEAGSATGNRPDDYGRARSGTQAPASPPASRSDVDDDIPF